MKPFNNHHNKEFLPGNIIPHGWYKRFCLDDGNPDLVSITNLADIVAWHRNGTNDHFGEQSAKFDGESLYISYKYFEKKFGFKQDRARRSFIRLETLGVLKRTFKNVELKDGTWVNRAVITLDGKFFESCFNDPEIDIKDGGDGQSG